MSNQHEDHEERTDKETPESVIYLPLSDLHPFPNQPFTVRDDQAMQETIESVKTSGVLTPAIVRPRSEGGYEIVSGHRRKRACEIAGLSSMPCIVRNLTDDEAIVQMVDSNAQRDVILPSEKAFAYEMKMDALRRQAGRPSKKNVRQVGTNLRTDEQIASETNESARQIQRYIRLTNLLTPLLDMVDNNVLKEKSKPRIALTPAVELSYLSQKDQQLVLETIDSEQATPSLSQAQRMRQLSAQGKLNEDSVLEIMSEQKKPESWNLTLPMRELHKYFPSSFSQKRIQETIFKLLDVWSQKRQRAQNQDR